MSDMPVDRTKQELTDGSPVPSDRSHTENRGDGQQRGYVVLSAEERAKGFVKPVRRSYIHQKCGTLTTMGRALCETYARDPRFYSGTFCCGCGAHFNLDQFHWEDGEPMEPDLQDAWGEQQSKARADRESARVAEIERTERAELARLKAKYEDSPAQSK
jgi:hypothetical protein